MPGSAVLAVPVPAAGRPRDYWHACSLHMVDGRVKRFGPDEEADADLPYAFQFDTQIPGGFGSGSIVIPRPPNLRADDAALFSHLEMYGPEGTMYEGLVTGMPQVGVSEIRLEVTGWSSHLEHDKTFREVFIDQDLSHWGGPSGGREAGMLAGGVHWVGSSEVRYESDGPVISVLFERLSTPPEERLELWYKSPVPLGTAWVQFVNKGGIGSPDASWNLQSLFSVDDVHTGGGEGGTDWNGVSGSEYHNAIAADRYYHFLYHAYVGTFTGDGNWLAHWRVALYGRHGLTRRGPDPGGFYASDIIAHALDRAAPQLTYTLGDSIEQSTYAVPHFVVLEPTTIRQGVIEPLTALGGAQLVPNDWGVYERREFFHKTPGTYGRTWRVRKDQVADLTSSGPDSQSRIGGIMISYRDGAGRTHSVGPPGSGADLETEDLLDSDPQNPANWLGRKWDHEQVGITNQEGALNIGRMLLAERNRVDWRGEVEIKGEATDEAGNVRPARQVRAGDQIVVEDEEGLWAPRSIMGTNYDDSLTVKASIGAPANRGEVLLAQLAAATDLVAT